MGFFDKIFGNKDKTDRSAAAPQAVSFISALTMHLRGEIDPALDAYVAIIEEVPEDNLAPFFAAAALAAKGTPGQAVELLRNQSRRLAEGEATISRVVCNDLLALLDEEPFVRLPAVAEVVVALGDTLKKEGFVQESAVCFEIAVGLSPEDAHVLHRLGDTLHDLRMYDYAEKVLQEALKHAPNHWGAIYTHAVLLQDLGRFAEAVEQYEKAVKLNPGHAKCRNNFGAALMNMNRLEEALEQCTIAADLEPDFPLVKLNLGNIKLFMGKYHEARDCFAEALSLNDNLALAHYGLGAAEDSLGIDPDRVAESYRKAIQLSPAFPEFHYSLAKVLSRQGNPESLIHFAEAAQLNGNMRYLHRDFGTACLNFGRREEALEHLKIALLQDPGDEATRAVLTEVEQTPSP